MLEAMFMAVSIVCCMQCQSHDVHVHGVFCRRSVRVTMVMMTVRLNKLRQSGNDQETQDSNQAPTVRHQTAIYTECEEERFQTVLFPLCFSNPAALQQQSQTTSILLRIRNIRLSYRHSSRCRARSSSCCVEGKRVLRRQEQCYVNAT